MGYRTQDAYKKLGYEWECYEAWLYDCEKFIKELRYDGFETNCNVAVEELSSYPSRKLSTEHPVDKKLFILPREYSIIPVESLVRQPPALPAVQAHPRIKLDDSEYPPWYSKFLAGETTRREALIKKAEALKRKIEDIGATNQRIARNLNEEIVRHSKDKTSRRSSEAIIKYANLAHHLPKFLRNSYDVLVDPGSRMALLEFEFPDYKNEVIITEYEKNYFKKDKIKYASEPHKKKLVRACLYSLAIRSAVIAASFNIGDLYDNVVVNVTQRWFDPATGHLRNGIIASLQARVDYLRQLSLAKLDPEACFRHLKGIATPSLDNASPVRPIFVMNRKDDRIVSGKDVDSSLEPEANLAAMEWEEFEHLVAQLFEWEFAKNGIEVKVTRASRDRGVDAILFDSDPLRGGKYVLQAKRYTNTVDVASVRDLYGTVINEGANRGILITTSSYGSDAYEFAKDKPLSLVDGTNLLLMLQKHGKRYRIDLEEARIINANAH